MSRRHAAEKREDIVVEFGRSASFSPDGGRVAYLLGVSEAEREALQKKGESPKMTLVIRQLAATDEDAAPLHSAFVPLICRDFFDDDAVLVIDGGNTAVWTNLYHEHRTPGCLLSTFKFGMLGAGPGQAIGAKVAYPDRQVYAIVGDGAMGMHVQEIETAVRHELPVVFLVLCDRQWGMVKVNQEITLDPQKTLTEGKLPEDQTINTDLGETRFDLLAESMSGGEMDLIADFAYLLPLTVVGEMLGVPTDDRERFKVWGSAVTASLEPNPAQQIIDEGARALVGCVGATVHIPVYRTNVPARIG